MGLLIWKVEYPNKSNIIMSMSVCEFFEIVSLEKGEKMKLSHKIILGMVAIGATLGFSTMKPTQSSANTFSIQKTQQNSLSVAESMGGQLAFPNSHGKLTISRFRAPAVRHSGPRLTYIEHVGPGILYFDNWAHRYTMLNK